MTETTQTYLGLESESSRQTNPGFQSVRNYIRERATSEYQLRGLETKASGECYYGK